MTALSADKNSLDVLISRRIRPDVVAMHAYPVQSSVGMLKLDAMENPFALPLALQAELGQRLGALALNRYPGERINDLRRALTDYAKVPEGMDVMIGNGSDELIAILSQAISKSNETVTVLAPAPSFVMYKMSGLFNHLNVVEIALNADDFSLDVAAFVAAIEQYKLALVYLPFPNNPTGNLFDTSAMRTIIEAAKDSIVVVDEAYQPFALDTWMGQLGEFDNLLVMRTVSKLGLAGIRLGYMAGSPALISELDKVRPPYNVNVLTEATATFVLKHADVLAQQADSIRAERTRVCAALAQMSDVRVYETAANFVLVRLSEAYDADAVFAGIRERGVLIKNMSHAHALLHNGLRITISTPEENTAMLTALQAALND